MIDETIIQTIKENARNGRKAIQQFMKELKELPIEAEFYFNVGSNDRRYRVRTGHNDPLRVFQERMGDSAWIEPLCHGDGVLITVGFDVRTLHRKVREALKLMSEITV